MGAHPPPGRLGRGTVVMAAAVGLVAATAGLFATASLQQDFAAFWVAGAAASRGLDPYANHAGSPAALWDGVAVFRHSRFLHPPLLAELFRPLAALPYPAAKLIFTALSIVLWLVATWIACRLAAPDEPEGAAADRIAVPALLGALFLPLHIHIERGQLDLAALVLLAGAILWRERPARAAGALVVAILLKPAAAGVLPFWALARRGRVLLGTAVAGAALLMLTVAVCGAERTRSYIAEVLPRVALFGEGGTEEMLLPDDRIAAAKGIADDPPYAPSLFSGPLSASLPRFLAPDAPERWALLLPYMALGALLAWCGRRARDAPDTEVLLLLGALPLCVVASPTGWAMGAVWALPLVPMALARRRQRRLGTAEGWLLGAGLALCALPDLLDARYALGLALTVGGACAALRTVAR